jgi:hypothetical protein
VLPILSYLTICALSKPLAAAHCCTCTGSPTVTATTWLTPAALSSAACHNSDMTFSQQQTIRGAGDNTTSSACFVL